MEVSPRHRSEVDEVVLPRLVFELVALVLLAVGARDRFHTRHNNMRANLQIIS
jgi:hypothetical protein